MKFKVGQRVIVTTINGRKLPGKIINVNNFREPGTEFAVDLDEYKDDFVFVGLDDLEAIDDNENLKEQI